MIGHSGNPAMHVRAPKLFCRDLLPGRSLDERGTDEKYRALIAHDDSFVAHCRDVRSPRSTRSQDGRYLVNSGARHARLVVENAAEMITVREDFGLQRKKGSAGVDKV